MFITSAVFIIVLAVIGFFIWYVPRYNTHAISATESCLSIFKEKGSEYFGEIGKNRFIFNEKMNTCLILNTVNDETTGDFRLILADMVHDDPIFYDELALDQEKDATYGLTRDQALDKVRSYGFIIF